MTASQRLIVLPGLRGKALPDGKVRITGKFAEGMALYAQRWPGEVAAILHPDDSPHSGNLDDISVDPRELSFAVKVVPFDSDQLLTELKSARVVQGGSDHMLNHVPAFCAQQGIAHVFVSEYSLRTRWQIIDAERPNPLVRLRRYAWAWNQERRNKAGVTSSAGVQCNGTPTYEAYAPLNKRTLLFFDSRVSEDMIPSSPAVLARIEQLAKGAPIRLAFSGRLNRMKGADDLLGVAAELRNLGVPFTMDICGDGELASEIKHGIIREQLSEQVRLRGVLDFQTELMPFIRNEIDLFICCHRQGDPSCTYLETFACGVPIAGYDNEAFAGLLQHCKGGWSSPMNDAKALARVVQRLHTEPARLGEAANTALAFARVHTEGRTFDARIKHMIAAGGL